MVSLIDLPIQNPDLFPIRTQSTLLIGRGGLIAWAQAGWFLTAQRQYLFTLAHQTVSPGILISLRNSWALRDNLPSLLSSGRVRTPPVWVLLLVFRGSHRLKGTTMQGEGQHIRGGERILRQMSEKELVDNAFAGVTDAALFLGSRMGGHHDAAAHARLSPQRHRGSRRAAALGHFPSG